MASNLASDYSHQRFHEQLMYVVHITHLLVISVVIRIVCFFPTPAQTCQIIYASPKNIMLKQKPVSTQIDTLTYETDTMKLFVVISGPTLHPDSTKWSHETTLNVYFFCIHPSELPETCFRWSPLATQ